MASPSCGCRTAAGSRWTTPLPHPAAPQEEPAAWHHALRDLVEQSTSGAVREVPAAVATQVAASPVLRNLAAGLAENTVDFPMQYISKLAIISILKTRVRTLQSLKWKKKALNASPFLRLQAMASGLASMISTPRIAPSP